jgi:hypothetical protein
MEVQLHMFFTLALERGESSASSPSHFIPKETGSGTHFIGGWVGPRARFGYDGKAKSEERNTKKKKKEEQTKRYTK